MPRPSVFLTLPVCALAACALTPRVAAAAPPASPQVTWWLSNAASTALVHPGERITFTLNMRKVRQPAKVDPWLCANATARPVCEPVNVNDPLIVDDLSPVMAHARYNGDARGATGTSISVQREGVSTVIIAKRARPGSTADVGFSFSVTVNHDVRPGMAIHNIARVLFTVEQIRPDPGVLSNCPLNVPLFAHPFTNGNTEEVADSVAALQATGGTLPPGCFGVSVVPPKPGGPRTGFGGLAGHVGNVGRAGKAGAAGTPSTAGHRRR